MRRSAAPAWFFNRGRRWRCDVARVQLAELRECPAAKVWVAIGMLTKRHERLVVEHMRGLRDPVQTLGIHRRANHFAKLFLLETGRFGQANNLCRSIIVHLDGKHPRCLAVGNCFAIVALG